jgi:hypothetical protein
MCLFRASLILFISTSSIFGLSAQSNFYNVDEIQDIQLNFYDNNWDDLLDSLYVEGEENRILAQAIINGEVYDSVGVRYKGFSSVSINYLKNPFNIKLDYVIEDQNHQGVEKLKLSNVIQDPSFVREVLSYEIARKYMPASQANYCNLFINDTLWGLYVNVEAVNKKFLLSHFDSKYNSFFKGSPENLEIQPGGQNADLSNIHGTDSVNYYPYYTIKSDNGWNHLYHLIDTLNNHEENIESVLNIDRALWLHAFNYSIINFDSYIGYAQNYYIYKSQSNQFNTIIWDLNMSFGGFRLSDASQLYFNGFDILQAQQMDPFMHYNYISVSPRPLVRQLFNNERHRKMYMAHIRTIIQENFINQEYYNRASYFQSLIDINVQNDSNKFYSYLDFVTNLNNQVSVVASICPGISQLMDARTEFLSNYEGFLNEPNLSNPTNSPEQIILGQNLSISVQAENADYVMLSYRFGNNQIFKNIEMYDDGNNNDGNENDGIYGVNIPNCSNSIDYYFYADNNESGVFLPVRAAYEYYSINSALSPGDLVVNELMSNNQTTQSDENGEFEDWVELFNTTSAPISTRGVFLSDNANELNKWELPNYTIEPNSYFIIWADDNNDGGNHANFQLSNLGEQLILANNDSTIIDAVSFVTLPYDMSYGRNPNGVGSFEILDPTFNNNNNIINMAESASQYVTAYPNPFSNSLYFDLKDYIVITNLLGREVYSGVVDKLINTSLWDRGIYIVKFKDPIQSNYKLIKIK